jgi:nitrite reductase (cytochrome c-552)
VGQNWPLQYDSYLRTRSPRRPSTGAAVLGASDAGARGAEARPDPWLKRIFAGYAFALDYRDRRGHLYALFDQEETRRVTEKQQPEPACSATLRISPSIVSSGRETSRRASSKSRECRIARPRAEGRQRPAPHPASRLLRRLPRSQDHGPPRHRPGFLAGIRALKAKQGVADYDPNRDATRQEMRSFVCGQCHVEYYFKGPGQGRDVSLGERPQGRGDRGLLRAGRFTDWVHAETGNKVLKAQHPEFEVWSQGVPRPSGGGLRGLPHALRARRRAQGERSLGAKSPS